MQKQFRVGVIILVTLVVSVFVAPFAAQDDTLDLRALPLGDGQVSDEPMVDHVFSCVQEFNSNAGAFRDGPWIDAANGTYNRIEKTVEVDGAVEWPSEFEIVLDGDRRLIIANGLPSHPTGVYPVASTDDAYNYDRNPNSIEEQEILYELPANPVIAAEASCVGFGAIGIMLTGGVFFNALDAPGRDAVAHEIQDRCDGHPESTGEYHYHDLSLCIENESPGDHSAMVGYALDGFGIYGRYGEGGEALTNADLDECHGHIHEIEWDGETVEMYHYHATWEYPYTVSCYRGEPIAAAMGAGPGGQQGQQPSGQQPSGGGRDGGQQPPPTRPAGG